VRSSRGNRAKGVAAEREVAALFQAAGLMLLAIVAYLTLVWVLVQVIVG
jgi:hypothetical protein